jgi:hypothetical protein
VINSYTQPTIKQQSTPAVDRRNTDLSEYKTLDMATREFNITKEKRQQLRGLLSNSQPLPPDEGARQRRSNGISLYDDERKVYHDAVDKVVRWNTFLVHTSLNLPEVVEFVSRVWDVNEEEYQRALAKAIESYDLFQTILCNNIWDYASDLIGASWNLEELESAALAQKISDFFSPHKFFAAFAFMEDYFNFECSSPLGKWYAKGIYVNMTCAIV